MKVTKILVAALVAMAAAMVLLAYPAQAKVSAIHGMSFNGSSYLVADTSINSNFTVSIWLNYSEFNGTGVAVAQGVGENEHSDWYVGTGGEVGPKTTCGIFSDVIVQGNYTAGWKFAESSFVGLHKWHNIVCVYNGSYIAMYIDGKFVNGTATPYAMAKGSIIEIGKRTSTFYINGKQTFAPFFGNMSNLQIYSRALNSSEVEKIYSHGISGKPVEEAAFYMPLSNDSDYVCLSYSSVCTAEKMAIK